MDSALCTVYNESVLNSFAPNVRLICHTVWCLEHLTVNVAEGISFPLWSSPHLNSSLLHITLAI
jgi:hypothetical protein